MRQKNYSRRASRKALLLRIDVKRGLSILLALVLVAGSGLLGARSAVAGDPPSQVVNSGTDLTNDLVDDDGHSVNIGKTIADTDVENEFIITLEVQTEKKLTEIVQPVSAAMVVIIDNSGTMWQDAFGPGGQGPNDALKHARAAASSFVKSFATAGIPSDMLGKEARENGFIRDIGVIEFSLGAEICLPLTDAVKDGGEGAATAIESIYGKGGTNLAAAIRLARNMIVEANYEEPVELHVVVLTDGAPNRDFYTYSNIDSPSYAVERQEANDPVEYKMFKGLGDYPQAPYFNATLGMYSEYGSIIGIAHDKIPDGQRTDFGGSGGTWDESFNTYIPDSFPVGHPIKIPTQDYALGAYAAEAERKLLIDEFEDDPNIDLTIHGVYCETGEGAGGAVFLKDKIVYNNGIYSLCEDIWSDFETLLEFFHEITDIVEQANVWCVRDQLAEHVVFLGPVDGSLVTLEIEAGKQYAVWDVYKTTCVEEDDKFYYTASFRVRIDNTIEEYYDPTEGYYVPGDDIYEIETNVEVVLEYFFEGDDNGPIPGTKKLLPFHNTPARPMDTKWPIVIPRVKTFAADLRLLKVDNGSQPLDDIDFKLYLAPVVAKGITGYSATGTSDIDGKLAFEKIPSGHTFDLLEYIDDSYVKIAEVEIAYGEVERITPFSEHVTKIEKKGDGYVIVNNIGEIPPTYAYKVEFYKDDWNTKFDETVYEGEYIAGVAISSSNVAADHFSGNSGWINSKAPEGYEYSDATYITININEDLNIVKVLYVIREPEPEPTYYAYKVEFYKDDWNTKFDETGYEGEYDVGTPIVKSDVAADHFSGDSEWIKTNAPEGYEYSDSTYITISKNEGLNIVKVLYIPESGPSPSTPPPPGPSLPPIQPPSPSPSPSPPPDDADGGDEGDGGDDSTTTTPPPVDGDNGNDVTPPGDGDAGGYNPPPPEDSAGVNIGPSTPPAGGYDREVPPLPNTPGSNITAYYNDDGELFYMEFDEDGVPLGAWTWDDDEEMWIFDDMIPLGDWPWNDVDLPQTGAFNPLPWLISPGLLLLALGLFLKFRFAYIVNKKKR